VQRYSEWQRREIAKLRALLADSQRDDTETNAGAEWAKGRAGAARSGAGANKAHAEEVERIREELAAEMAELKAAHAQDLEKRQAAASKTREQLKETVDQIRELRGGGYTS
jgi:hypothetical protein